MIYRGVITAVIGSSPGPASGISYGVSFKREGGTVNVEGVKPVGGRFPDELNTVAAPVGTPVIVQDWAGQHYLMPPGETFELEECEEPAP
ncbi:MAG: hypothetical protein MJH10_08685 [Epibacterium sp.]|nr:hypothetical protein [Epibacterium sp.]NQX73611.1 hypothetical protein [Epibacterium sp.]